MSARAMWKGVIGFGGPDGGVRVPVKLYAAVEDRAVHFRLLHAADGHPVEQRMIDPTTGATVPRDATQRGVEVEDGVYVIVHPEELAALEPPPSRDIAITRFVPPAAIRSQLFLRPYYLGPDGDEARYFALAKAMREEGRAGLAHWVMRKKRYFGALESDGTHLLLVALRPAEEVITLAAPIAPQTGRRPDRRELELAEQLVRSFERPFEPAAFRDEYAARLRELVETKAHGGTVERAPVERRKEPASLADALAASLRTAEEAARG